jgi:NAD(P)-dependent dehydrogenase (short-subunit alcohol dehydrogenase family)
MNNAGIQPGSQMFGPHENWQRILSVDLWGVINGSQVFAPQIIARPARVWDRRSRKPKKRGPFHLVPVMAKATWERLPAENCAA